MTGTLALLVALGIPAPQAARSDLAERVVALDKVWIKTPSPERRGKAVPAISGAVTGFFTNQYADVSKQLDLAIAALEGRSVRAADALKVRFDPPFVSPGEKSKLRIEWAYAPLTSTPVEVQLGMDRRTLEPGAKIEYVVTGKDREGAQIAELIVGGLRRPTRLEVVRDLEERLKKIEAVPATKPTADAIRGRAAGTYETDFSVIEWLGLAERVAFKDSTKVETTPVMRHGKTDFRAFVPKSATSKTPVVIAFHGAGGSENMFFDGYGAGLAVAEARKRGWIFISPRSAAPAAVDVLDWLKAERGLEPTTRFVMGHSMGGGIALQTGSISPTALALFAPAALGIPASLAKTPTYLAVGKQEIMMLKTGAERMAATLSGREDSQFRQFDPCEHLMIVADALPEAFAFFDKQLKAGS